MASFILRSNSLPNLYSAKGSGLWAFSKRKTMSSDKGLKSFLDKNLRPGTRVLGVLTGTNGGALMRGTVRSSVRNDTIKDQVWEGEYNFPVAIDWEFIREDRKLVNLKSALGKTKKLSGGGHFPMQISDSELEKILTA
jgi:hypothetical protein